MSCFKNPRFAKELAYRTMVNYYLLRDLNPETEAQQSPELRRVLQKMRIKGFDTSMKYEITLVLNSIIGLLILPQQEYYSESLSSRGFQELPTLEACMKTDQYKNTYRERTDKPALIIKHMRNAVAHDRIMIIPESANGKDITHIRFMDAAYIFNDTAHAINGNDLSWEIDKHKRLGHVVCEFDLRISVDKLEAVLMEIADYLISFAE